MQIGTLLLEPRMPAPTQKRNQPQRPALILANSVHLDKPGVLVVVAKALVEIAKRHTQKRSRTEDALKH